jgi:hypothetical protein
MMSVKTGQAVCVCVRAPHHRRDLEAHAFVHALARGSRRERERERVLCVCVRARGQTIVKWGTMHARGDLKGG